MSENAWTPGPWARRRWGVYAYENGGGEKAADCMAFSKSSEQAEADAALIALAPEMAEAILAWDEHDGVYGYGYPAVDLLRSCVERLRAINEEQA